MTQQWQVMMKDPLMMQHDAQSLHNASCRAKGIKFSRAKANLNRDKWLTLIFAYCMPNTAELSSKAFVSLLTTASFSILAMLCACSGLKSSALLQLVTSGLKTECTRILSGSFVCLDQPMHRHWCSWSHVWRPVPLTLSALAHPICSAVHDVLNL